MKALKFRSATKNPVKLSGFMLIQIRCLQLLGMCPVTITFFSPTENKQKHNYEIQPNQPTQSNHSRNEIFHLIWMGVYVMAIILINLYGYYNFDQVIYSADNVGRFYDIMKLITNTLAHLITIFEAVSKRQQMRLLLKRYTEVHANWTTGNLKQDFRIYQRYVINFNVLLIFTVAVTTYYMIYIQYMDQWVQYYIVFLPSSMFCHLRLLQFMLFLELVIVEIQQINKNICALVAYTRSLIRDGANVTAFTESEILLELQILLCRYKSIYEMVKLLKQSMSWSVIALYIRSYIQILSDCYWTYWILYNNIIDGGIVVTFPVLPTVLVLFQTFLFGHLCMRKVKLLSHYIHKMRHQVEDLKMSARIINFSLLLLHQRIRLDMNGFFVVDCGMVKGLLSSITMFMMFYIQFMPKFKNI